MSDLPADLGDLARWAVARPWLSFAPPYPSWGGFDGERIRGLGSGVRWIRDPNGWRLDLSDQPTLGALLGLLRERCGEHGFQLTTSYDGDGQWGADGVHRDDHVWGLAYDYGPDDAPLLAVAAGATGPTEAHAILAALEAVHDR